MNFEQGMSNFEVTSAALHHSEFLVDIQRLRFPTRDRWTDEFLSVNTLL